MWRETSNAGSVSLLLNSSSWEGSKQLPPPRPVNRRAFRKCCLAAHRRLGQIFLILTALTNASPILADTIPPYFSFRSAVNGASYNMGSVQAVCDEHAANWDENGAPGTKCKSVAGETYVLYVTPSQQNGWYGGDFTFAATRAYFCPPGYSGPNTLNASTTTLFCTSELLSVAKNTGEFCGINGAGNPINAGYGNKVQLETDYQGQGGSGFSNQGNRNRAGGCP